MNKDEIIKIVESEKWYPATANTTDFEMEVSKIVNNILDNIVEKIKNGKSK